MLVIFSAGIALLHLQVAYRVHGDAPETCTQHLKAAARCLEISLKELSTRRLTFLCGASGPLALAASLYHLLGNTLTTVILLGVS